MTNHNVFVIYNCKKRKNVLITSSARKAKSELRTGIKIEVWNESGIIETIYARYPKKMNRYISLQKEYIAKKQLNAELKNKRRKSNEP